MHSPVRGALHYCTLPASEGNNYRLVIADNGIGIPDEIDVVKTRSPGLYLTRFIVKHRQKGSIDVSSGNGTASTFLYPEQMENHAGKEAQHTRS